MRRRGFVAGLAGAAWLSAAQAQQTGRVFSIGMMDGGTPPVRRGGNRKVGEALGFCIPILRHRELPERRLDSVQPRLYACPVCP